MSRQEREAKDKKRKVRLEYRQEQKEKRNAKIMEEKRKRKNKQKWEKLAKIPRILKNKADCKAEVHFIGQIIGGLEFDTDDGLFCQMELQTGKYWQILSPPCRYQTHTTYARVRKISGVV